MFDEMDRNADETAEHSKTSNGASAATDDELAALLRRAFEGEQAVYRQLVDALTPVIQVIVVRCDPRGQSSSLVEDVVQDVLTQLIVSDQQWFQEWRAERGSLGAFIYGVARRRARDALRKYNGQRRWVLDDSIAERAAHPAPGVEPRVEHRQQLDFLDECGRKALTKKQADSLDRLISEECAPADASEDGFLETKLVNNDHQARRRLRLKLRKLWLAHCGPGVLRSPRWGSGRGGLRARTSRDDRAAGDSDRGGI